MARKEVQGQIRNKSRSKEKLLQAVGTILRTKGYAHVGINAIAQVSGVSKPLIYEYFGNLDGLIDAYIKQHDYWKILHEAENPSEQPDHGRQYILDMLNGQFDALHNNKDLQKMILWELSESRASLVHNSEKRDEQGDLILKEVTNGYFEADAKRFRAIMALLIAGSNYLNIHNSVNGSKFCGLDLKDEADRDAIKDAIAFIINNAYEKK